MDQIMLKAMGIDGSATSTGVVVLSAQTEGTKRDMVWSANALQIKGYVGLERAVRQVEALDELLASLKPDLVVFEGYAYKNAHTLATLVEVGTCLRLACRRRDCRMLDVSPTELKKFAGVKNQRGLTPKVRKARVAKAVKGLWGYENDCHDIVDAYVLAQMGLLLLGEKPDGWKSWQLGMRKTLTT